jgi:hypothetical protein
MAATDTTNTGTAGGRSAVHMNAADTHAIAYAARKGWGPSRTLAAIGHPGYGRQFAARVLAIMADRQCDAFTAKDIAYAERGVR